MTQSDLVDQTLASIARAKDETRAARIRLGACPDCGIPQRLHRGVTGAALGCETAAYVRRVSDQPLNPERWNDPHAELTRLAEAAMVDGTCGPRVEIQMAGYTKHERLDIAAALVRVIVGGYVAQISRDAQGDR